jgi:hypothetical protein
MSGVNGNVIMSGCGDDNPDDEGREAARCVRFFALQESLHPERGEGTSIEADERERRLRA